MASAKPLVGPRESEMAATVDGGGSLSSLPDIHSISDEDELKRLVSPPTSHLFKILIRKTVLKNINNTGLR